MHYPLPETIGSPDLFVGREEELEHLNEWLERITKRISMSTVILARRKSGKTAILERIFNLVWSNPQMGIIPFYLSMGDKDIWIRQFAMKYYRTFASHCISFLERDSSLVTKLLTFDTIRKYGVNNKNEFFVDDIDSIKECKSDNESGEIWDIACSAPHRFAAQFNTRVLIIIDEFQYFSNHIFFDQNCTNLDKSMPGSFHGLVESKIAPMLVSGSYVSWMLSLMEEYLEAGRLDQYYISPYLKPDEGLQAVYKYAEHFNQPITNETAEQINTLCLSDPFFILCVIKNSIKNTLLTKKGVIEAVNSELTGKHSRMSKTWAEYINKTVAKINDKYAKDILLHLCKNNERSWTPEDLKNTLKIDLTNKEIHQRLEQMLEADIIEDGGSDVDYKGLTDGTLYLVLRHRFEKEIKHHKPDFKTDFENQIDLLETEKKSLRGKLSNLIGKFAEYQLATDMRTRKKFSLGVYFTGIEDKKVINITDVRVHFKFQRDDGKEMEIDIKAESDCKRVVLIEVKKWKTKVGVQVIKDFVEKIQTYSSQQKNKKIIPAILSVSGFTVHAKKLCLEKNIGMAERGEWREC
ncbi:protein containing ATPase domain, prokaryote [Candidatus Magnetomorum sp. HK-1]|nr:protein containing ATPase domain, prokaryote [Candidatus Magnetomorum sp. HK-1]